MTLDPSKDSSCVLAFDWGEPSGGFAYDLSQHGNYGVIYGAVRQRGRLNHALKFDGIDDYVLVNNSASLELKDEISVVMWVYRFKEGIVNGNFNKGFDYYGYITATNKAQFRLVNSAGVATVIFGSSDIYSHKWYMITRVYDGKEATDNMMIYLNDAILDAVGTFNGPIRTSTSNISIGATTPTTELMYGLIGSVRIYNRALSEKEIREMYYYGEKQLSRVRFPMFYREKRGEALALKV